MAVQFGVDCHRDRTISDSNPVCFADRFVSLEKTEAVFEFNFESVLPTKITRVPNRREARLTERPFDEIQRLHSFYFLTSRFLLRSETPRTKQL